MALNFPDSPTLNEVYTDATSGFSYVWNGSVWTSFESSTASNIQELDDISGSFNGVTATFALTVGGQSITPVTTNQLVISVGGVMQNPTNDFYISGSNIVFTTPPAGGLTFFGTLLGTALSLNTIADGSVTPLKLSTGGPSWNTDGDVYIAGITTVTNGSGTVTIGIGTTALLVEGNARVTGILTVGSSSITLDGTSNAITVGTGLTLSSDGIIAGIITATSFVGDGSGLTGAGSTVADDTTTNATFYPLFTTITDGTVTATKVSTSKLTFNPSTGTVVATTFSGSGASLTSIPNSATTATSTNTGSTIVARDGSGNFSAGTITATTFSGNASTATTLQTSRTINGISFNGSANIITNPTTGAYSNGNGARTVSTGSPTGGSDGDIWYKY